MYFSVTTFCKWCWVFSLRERGCCFCCRQVAEPEVRYDPVRLEEQLFKQPVKWLVRNVELFVPLGTFVAKVIFDIQVRYTRQVRFMMGGAGFGARSIGDLEDGPSSSRINTGIDINTIFPTSHLTVVVWYASTFSSSPSRNTAFLARSCCFTTRISPFSANLLLFV